MRTSNSSSKNNLSYEIIFCSDIHLTLKNIDLAQQHFEKQLEDITINTIVLNGDFVDESVEYYNKDDMRLFLIKLNSLLDFLNSKCNTIVWIFGNHDEFFIKKYSKSISKNLQIEFMNYFSYTTTTHTYIFLHGHALDSRYIYHQILRYMPFKKYARRFVKTKFRDIKNVHSTPNSKKIIQLTKQFNSNNTHNNTYVIFGHFHKEKKYRIEKTFCYQSKNWNFKNSIPLYAIPHNNSIIQLF